MSAADDDDDVFDSSLDDVISNPIDMDISSSSGAISRSKSKKKKGVSSNSSDPNENTGRWTAEEHRLFLQGLEQHGKGWKKIASLIKSRTVVQIRTHAQKYFQKLQKARQNGEEGDVTMEGRGNFAPSVPISNAITTQVNKRRRQTTGTKRKAIHSVVASAERQGKKIAKEENLDDPPLPAVAPTLAHFVLPKLKDGKTDALSSPISGPALEDSIFRFLSVAPPANPAEPPVSDIARQAGASAIHLPTDIHTGPSLSGEISPTGVNEISLFPAWTDAKESPSWYTKGADVDALLDVADGLDWLADAGDTASTYQPNKVKHDPSEDAGESGVSLADTKRVESTGSLPRIDSSMVPNMINHGASESASDFRNLKVFDEHDLEHEFVSSMLEDGTDE